MPERTDELLSVLGRADLPRDPMHSRLRQTTRLNAGDSLKPARSRPGSGAAVAKPDGVGLLNEVVDEQREQTAVEHTVVSALVFVFGLTPAKGKNILLFEQLEASAAVPMPIIAGMAQTTLLVRLPGPNGPAVRIFPCPYRGLDFFAQTLWIASRYKQHDPPSFLLFELVGCVRPLFNDALPMRRPSSALLERRDRAGASGKGIMLGTVKLPARASSGWHTHSTPRGSASHDVAYNGAPSVGMSRGLRGARTDLGGGVSALG